VSFASWETVEDAIASVVRAETGIVVLWKDQGAPRPPLPYVALRHDGGSSASALTERMVSDNPDGQPGDPSAVPPSVGTELLLTEIEQVDFRLEVETFSPPEAVGAAHAVAIARGLRNALAKESVRNALEAAGVVVADRSGPVQNLTGLVETDFEGRALFEVGLRAAFCVADTSTYIETAQINGTLAEGQTETTVVVTVQDE